MKRKPHTPEYPEKRHLAPAIHTKINTFGRFIAAMGSIQNKKDLSDFCRNFPIEEPLEGSEVSLLSYAIINRMPLSLIVNLIDLGAKVTGTNTENNPLLYAVTTPRAKQIDLITILLKSGAYRVAIHDPNYRLRNTQPILTKALLQNDVNKKAAFNLLIDYGADGIQPNEDGISAFDIACNSYRETGDDEWKVLANKILLESYERGQKISYNYLPLAENRMRIFESWSQNINLLSDEALNKISKGIPFIPLDVFQEEIERRERNQPLATPKATEPFFANPAISPSNNSLELREALRLADLGKEAEEKSEERGLGG